MAHALDLNELKRAVLKEGRTTCFHRIGVTGEFMAMTHGSNVRRWKRVEEKKQEWLIVPADADGYCHVFNRENHELLGATPTGTLWVAPATGGEEQLFKFVNPRPLPLPPLPEPCARPSAAPP